MKAKVNLQLLKTTTFDSGALGLLAMVAHQFPAPGRYRVTVMHRDRAVTDLDFVVDEESEVMQLDIDLAQAVRDFISRPEDDCNCRDKEQAAQIVSPKGYALFHASSGSGFSARVSSVGGEQVFDSTRLGEGDLFAVSLLEPGGYSMTNTVNSAAGDIMVNPPPEDAKRIRNLETQYIDAGGKTFKPNKIELTSSQGLVFRIGEPTRILIERKKGPREESGRPGIRWQKHQLTRREPGKK